MTMYGIVTSAPVTVVWCSSPVSYTATIEGWFSAAALCASRRNRSWKESSRARSDRSTFTATVRCRRRSSARKTSAMPP